MIQATLAQASSPQPEAEARPESLAISVLSQMDPAFPRTHSIAALRLCAGLAAQGHRVELVVPAVAKPTPPPEALFRTYDMEPSFDVRYLSVGGRSGDYDSWTLRRLVGRHFVSAVRGSGPRVLISDGIRLMLPYVAATRVGIRRVITAPWLHEFRGTRLERLTCANATCVLATCNVIVNELAGHAVSRSPTFITGNPVPRERVEFGRNCSKQEARAHLGLDAAQTVIAYTGKLYLGMKELDHLLSAAARMPDCLFLLTGGQPPVIEELRRQLTESGTANVHLSGMLAEPEETRFYQQAADVLVTYYSTEDLPFARHHIPSKLAEYMTTGNPIVAADFPAVRDLLNPQNAILAKPDDADALVEALSLAIGHPDRAAALGSRAQQDVATHTSESVGAELGRFLAALSEHGQPGAA